MFSACLSLPATAENIPELKRCTSIVLRTSEGWWLVVNTDGSGAYGFGALPERIQVKKGAFDFRQIYTETRTASVEKRNNAEVPFITVSFYVTSSSSAREYYLSQGGQLLARLFPVARDNVVPPSNEIEARSHDKIGAFWKRNPSLSPDTPDAVGGK